MKIPELYESTEQGDIRAHQSKNEIEINDFLTGEKEIIKIDESITRKGHGGGDERLLRDFLDAVEGKPSEKKTSALNSLQSHLMAFAAEKSRKEGRAVEIEY